MFLDSFIVNAISTMFNFFFVEKNSFRYLAFFPEFWKTVSSQNIGAQMNFVNCYYDNHL